jgi:hypothetical protein
MKIKITETKNTHYIIDVVLPEVNEYDVHTHIVASPKTVYAWLEKQGINDIKTVDGPVLQNWQHKCTGLYTAQRLDKKKNVSILLKTSKVKINKKE